MNKQFYKEQLTKPLSLLEFMSRPATTFDLVKTPDNQIVLYPFDLESQEVWEIENVQALIELLQESLKFMPLDPNRVVRVIGEDNE